MFSYKLFLCLVFLTTIIKNVINDCNDFLPSSFYEMARNKSYVSVFKPISTAALYFSNDDFCVGSLISHNYVLTVASCVKYMDSVVVILGAYHLQEPNVRDQIMLRSTKMKIHPNFINDEYILNDIALIKLPHSVKFNKFIQPVRLPPADTNMSAYAGHYAHLINYEDIDDEPAHLVYRPLKIITNKDCHYKILKSLTLETLMCTKGVINFSGCEENEGSQLIINNTLIGMMSYAFFTCHVKTPLLYTRISAFRKWISENSDVPLEY